MLSLVVVLALMACRGHQGPEGPMGPPGDGDAVIGQTFEFEDVDFEYEADNDLWSTVIEVPDDIEVLDSDAILVYRLETVEGTDGPLDTYSLLPQVFYVDNGSITYVFNHTANDVELMIDGDFDLSNLSTDFTDAQIFRFVAIPSDFANDPNTNIETFGDLQRTGIDLEEF